MRLNEYIPSMKVDNNFWEYFDCVTCECEVGTVELLPFDVAKKCDEIHKTWKLGKPHYKLKVSRSDQKRLISLFMTL